MEEQRQNSFSMIQKVAYMTESEEERAARAGVEIGVASTKAFTTQLVALLVLTIELAKPHKIDSTQEA